MYKKLGWTAVAGFSVGFVSLFAAYATGGTDFMNWAGPHWSNLHRFDKILLSGDKCSGDATVIDTTKTERRLAWTAEDKVRITTSGTVRYRGGEGDEVIVRGDPAVIANVKIRGNRIELDCDGFGRADVDITLPGRVFREITLAGSADITMENVDQPSLELSIAGSGTLEAQGSVDSIDIRIAGSGNAKLANLQIKKLEISVAGSGDAEAGPTEEADIKIAGSGNIRLLTRPKKMETKMMGSGRIIFVGDAT
jgi:hypothetical protein